MTNQLIKNETNVFYSIKVKDKIFVRRAEFSGGRVYDVIITNDQNKSVEYSNKETAFKIAQYVDGKVLKHTRTEVITEVIEEETE